MSKSPPKQVSYAQRYSVGLPRLMGIFTRAKDTQNEVRAVLHFETIWKHGAILSLVYKDTGSIVIQCPSKVTLNQTKRIGRTTAYVVALIWISAHLTGGAGV